MIDVIIPNTNDNFHYQLEKRISKSLELNLLFLEKSKFNNKVNFTIVDWGSKKKFSDVLTLDKKIANKIFFFNIPKNIAIKFSESYENIFNGAISSNIGFRRTKEKYILQIAHDQIIPTFCWDNLFNFIHMVDKKKVVNPVLYIPRFQLEKDFLLKNPNYNTLNNYIMNSIFNFQKTSNIKINLGSGCSFLMKSKQIKKLKGFSEISNFSNDLAFHIKLNNDGSSFFDGRNLGVYSLKFPTLKNSRRLELIKKNRNFFYSSKLIKTNSNWGLANYKFKKIKSTNSLKKIQNNFDFLDDKNEIDNDNFEKIIRNNNLGYFNKNTNLKLIIFFYIFKYTSCIKFISFSRKNYHLSFDLQNFAKYVEVYFCYKNNDFKKIFFETSLLDNLRNNAKFTTGKHNFINLDKLSKIFHKKQDKLFAVYIDDLFNTNILKFQEYYLFIVIEKKNYSKIKFINFKSFFEVDSILILINKKYERHFKNKNLFIKGINHDSKKNFRYKILIIKNLLKLIFKKLLKW